MYIHDVPIQGWLEKSGHRKVSNQFVSAESVTRMFAKRLIGLKELLFLLPLECLLFDYKKKEGQ